MQTRASNYTVIDFRCELGYELHHKLSGKCSKLAYQENISFPNGVAIHVSPIFLYTMLLRIVLRTVQNDPASENEWWISTFWALGLVVYDLVP